MMTQPVPDQQTPRPLPAPRLLAAHIAGRTWTVRTTGPGAGSAWGHALAALDYRSHGVTAGTRPTFWIDQDALRILVVECAQLGVRLESVDTTSLPTVGVR